MRVALDAGVRDALAKPDELREALDRVRAHRRRPRRDEERDADQRECAAAAESGDGACAEKHRGEGEPEAEHGRHRAGEHDAESARDERHDRPASPRRPTVAERDADRADDEQPRPESAARSWIPTKDGSRWPGRFPSNSATIPRNWSSPHEVAATLQATKRADDRDEVGGRADEQHGRGQKRRVPAELREADRVAREVVVLAEEGGRGERGRRRRGGRPRRGRGRRARGGACCQPSRRLAERCRDEHASDRRVGERHVDRRRPDPERCARLVRRVEEEERDGGSEDERLASPRRPPASARMREPRAPGGAGRPSPGGL